MTRKQFIESHGATCKNWTWSWSFINKKDKIIFFGAWIDLTIDGEQEILNENWIFSREGRSRKGSFNEAIENIRLIEEEGYTLKTFPMIRDERDEFSLKRSSIKKIIPEELKIKFVKKEDIRWLALDKKDQQPAKESPTIQCEYPERRKLKEKSGYVYERNAEARKKCIEHHSYRCKVCGFDFEKIYGAIGKEYIHVHHIIPISTIKQECKIDPIKDLIPVCPNCHAMIHRGKSALTVEQLKAHLKKKRHHRGISKESLI